MSNKLSITVPLSFAIATKGKDGVAKMLDNLTIARPKTRHVKKLATIVGADVLKALISAPTRPAVAIPPAEPVEGDVKPPADEIDMAALATDVLPSLLSPQKLDDFLGLIADMASLTADEVGELDPADFIAVLVAVAGFFPALQSIASSSLART